MVVEKSLQDLVVEYKYMTNKSSMEALCSCLRLRWTGRQSVGCPIS